MTCVLSDSPKCLLFSQSTWNDLSQTFKFLIEKKLSRFSYNRLSLVFHWLNMIKYPAQGAMVYKADRQQVLKKVRSEKK